MRNEEDADKVVRFPVEIWGPQVWQANVAAAADSMLSGATDEECRRVWSDFVIELATELRRRGATDLEVFAQWHAFNMAVHDELVSRRSGADPW